MTSVQDWSLQLWAKPDQRQVARCLLSHWSKRPPTHQTCGSEQPGRSMWPPASELRCFRALDAGSPWMSRKRRPLSVEICQKKKGALFLSLSRQAAGASWQLQVQGEPAVSYKWTGWVSEITGWSCSRLQEKLPILLEEFIEYTPT